MQSNKKSRVHFETTHPNNRFLQNHMECFAFSVITLTCNKWLMLGESLTSGLLFKIIKMHTGEFTTKCYATNDVIHLPRVPCWTQNRPVEWWYLIHALDKIELLSIRTHLSLVYLSSPGCSALFNVQYQIRSVERWNYIPSCYDFETSRQVRCDTRVLENTMSGNWSSFIIFSLFIRPNLCIYMLVSKIYKHSLYIFVDV